MRIHLWSVCLEHLELFSTYIKPKDTLILSKKKINMLPISGISKSEYGREKGGFKKISGPEDKPKKCRDNEHNPPDHIVLKPGTYEYTCPSCGATRIITVPEITP